jgi:hypothetical protein
MSTVRNDIDTTNVIESEAEFLDTLYEICDAEFTSREDIHNSFVNARGQKSWANTLRWEVQKIANRDGIQCGQYTAQKVADRIANDWFAGF